MKYLSFDIESCDGGKGGSLCSFGYCIADENFNILEQEDILVNPNKKFNKRLFGKVIKLAYTEEEFRAAPRFNKVYDRIRALFKDVVVIGFSVMNDVLYLEDSITAYNKPDFDYDFYDVQLMYSLYKNNHQSASLGAAAGEFGIEFLEHRSVDDAVATLKLLQAILHSTGKTFQQLLTEYEIHPGKTHLGYATPCYTERIIGEVDFDSEKVKKVILNEFLLSLPAGKVDGKPFSRKVVCFDEDIELGRFDEARSLIVALYEQGGRYANSTAMCNTFVYRQAGSDRYNSAKQYARHKRINFITYEDFTAKIGDFQRYYFDDMQFLRDHHKRKRDAKFKL